MDHYINLFGLLNVDTTNYRSLVTPSHILEAIKPILKFKEYKSNIPVVIFEGNLLNQNSIYLMVIEGNFYAMMYFFGLKRLYIADGNNKVYESRVWRTIQEKLKTDDTLPMQIIRMKNMLHRERSDLCGSSTAAIIILFSRMYKKKLMFRRNLRIAPASYWAEQIKAKLDTMFN